MSSTSIHVRILTAADTEDFIRLRRLSLTTDPEAFCATPESDPALDPVHVRPRLEVPSLTGHGVVLGAYTGELVGLLGLAPEERAGQQALRLWGYFVVPKMRGKGAGQALLETAVALARKDPDIAWLDLEVRRGSRAAIALYRSVGFEQIASSRQQGSEDRLQFRLSLRPSSA